MNYDQLLTQASIFYKLAAKGLVESIEQARMILGVSENDTLDEIKRKYKQLVVKFHTDTSHDPEKEYKIRLINSAYEVLKDDPSIWTDTNTWDDIFGGNVKDSADEALNNIKDSAKDIADVAYLIFNKLPLQQFKTTYEKLSFNNFNLHIVIKYLSNAVKADLERGLKYAKDNDIEDEFIYEFTTALANKLSRKYGELVHGF